MRESVFFALLLMTAALLMHPDLLDNPAARFSLMNARANALHPLLYTIPLYVIVLIFRVIIRMIAQLFRRTQ